ncbi:hypothetical protein NC651_037851 [Populus alba x Populus x berolinensis]|nr:hypothetical protein NC651_037851 [Populus alba x Populus x berolinensis]
MDLNWLLQFIFTVFVIGLGLLHLVNNTASKYFEAAESNHTVIDPCIVCRCVNCGTFGNKSSINSLGCQKKHWKAGHRLKCKDFGASSSRTAKSNSKPIIEKPGVTNPNFWEDPVRGTDSHNGWGAAVASTHSAAGGGGWVDEAPRKDYNGWGAAVASTHSAAGGSGWMDEAPTEDYNGWGAAVASTHSAAGGGGWVDEAPRKDYNGWGAAVASTHSAAGGSGWMDEAPTEDYNGWGAAVASTHSAAGGGGWMDEAPREDYNGWGVPNMGPSGSQGHVQTHDDIPHVFETSRGNTASAPSAPPIPDGAFDDEPIHHPSIDFSPPDLSVPAIELGASVTSDHVNEGGTSSCIICWEAPVEGACIPCGHMAGCMACLSEIKAKKGVCPVCRSNINQRLRPAAPSHSASSSSSQPSGRTTSEKETRDVNASRAVTEEKPLRGGVSESKPPAAAPSLTNIWFSLNPYFIHRLVFLRRGGGGRVTGSCRS